MNLIDACLDLLVPDTCLLCGQMQSRRNPHLLCHFCWAALPRNIVCCSSCAVPLAQPGVCGQCQQASYTGLCIAPLLHQAEGRFLAHQLKFHNGFRAGRTLAAVMLQAAQRVYRADQWPQCLVPVPLSYRRQIRRGYNQAAWLAHCLQSQQKHRVLPAYYGPIKRRHGPSQQTLSKRARLTLARDTFTSDKPLPYHHVAIVDDVLTTGATTRVLRNMLHNAGVPRVDIWCATRAMPN